MTTLSGGTTDGDFIDIGPQCFASKDELVINWKGSNYYRTCGEFITELNDRSQTHCVNRVDHPGIHEDFYGNTKRKQIIIQNLPNGEEIND